MGRATGTTSTRKWHETENGSKIGTTIGAVAQLGERLNGIQEADGSIPFSSTVNNEGLRGNAGPFVFSAPMAEQSERPPPGVSLAS